MLGLTALVNSMILLLGCWVSKHSILLTYSFWCFWM